jgi:dihydrolipoamide dehydrogenase
MSVVLVERDKLGGTCLHYGCIPTKALLHAADVADSARDGDRIGVKSSLAGIDMAGSTATRTASSPSSTRDCRGS